MYKNLLVPLDGSKLAEVVLPYAAQLAIRFNMNVTLLHVCGQNANESKVECGSYLEHAAEQLRKDLNRVRTGSTKPLEVTTDLREGEPADEILHRAEEQKFDLIMIATHGRSGVSRWVLGSVTEKVLRRSGVPVWLVRSNIPEAIVYDKWNVRTILVALDGSRFAESVLPHVKQLTKQSGGEPMNVVLLRVVEEPLITADYPYMDWKEHIKEIKKHFRDEASDYLAKVEKRLSGDGLKVKKVVLMGKPVNKIIDYAAKYPPNLIVMATHGSSGISRWEYGNVTDKILRGVSSPVLLVRPGR